MTDAPPPAPQTRAEGEGSTLRALARSAWDRAQRERAAGDLAASCNWLERAHRLVPDDALVSLTLGAFRLELGLAAEAAPLLDKVARQYDSPEAWIALASCHLARDAEAPCVEALERALRSTVVTPALTELAGRVVQRFGRPGWCGLNGDGRVQFGPGRPAWIALDGIPIRGSGLPRSWSSGRVLEVTGRNGPFLGSPLPVQLFRATEGFVEAREGGIEGWAWHPTDASRDPLILIRGPTFGTMLTATEPAEDVAHLRPLARPRRFALSAGQVQAMGHPISVTGEDGRPLLGSPLDPSLERRESFAPCWVDSPATGAATDTRHREVDVVIPVYRGAVETVACLESVLASVPASTVVHVVDDASPEPELAAAVEALHAAGRIRLLRHAENRGFPAAANAGLRAAEGRDVALLNSDTLVAAGWLDRLRRAAYSAAEIGSVTPLSNDATIASYPDPDGTNPVPNAADTAALDRVALRANASLVADLPVGVGFCLYLRRDCLDQVGLFREDLFAQGYGEENDWCLRARRAGWRHVAALDVFVAHLGGRSFGRGREHLLRRNTAILNRLHPGYDALIAAHIAADPLFAARRRMDALGWACGRSRAGSVLLVTHGEGGGVEEAVQSRCAALRAEGLRPIVLRPGQDGCQVDAFPNLRHALPAELPVLAALLRPDRPRWLEVHHLLGHDRSVLELAGLLEIPVETWVHDYASLCPRIALVGRDRRYCGEPDVEQCEDCVADLGSLTGDPTGVADLLTRSASELGGSRRVVTGSRDTAQRLRRHFPLLHPEVRPWEDDRRLPEAEPGRKADTTRICVVGAIGVEKGYDVLLACVRDARRRGLALEFVVCGYTQDDERLLAAGPVQVTGRYAAHEAVKLIRAQRAELALIPSVWPETWCFALSRAWEAGLNAVAFDLGAQAERIRGTGRGWLLPLELPIPAINDALLRLASPTGALPSSQP